MKHTIRFIILFFALVITGASHVWAITADDVTINVQPNSSAGTVSEPTIAGSKVTITATPNTGYSIDADHIVAEKMVSPSASSARHASGLASRLTVTAEGSNQFSFTIPDGYAGAYVTVNFFKATANGITSLDQITDLSGTYVLTADINAAGFSGKGEFTGTLDGGFHKIYNLTKPLFSSTSGSAVIRNITFVDVSIDVSGDAGAVTANAGGSSRIYNCGILSSSTERDDEGNVTGFSGSTIRGTGNVGGIVGTLSGSARVINCYSYANITGGSVKAGIVGYNSYASKSSSVDGGEIRTMVMNCMFYGDISIGNSVYPIYGGLEISNENTSRLNNYNYFRYESPFSKNNKTVEGVNTIITSYNRALSAEERYLKRFEFYRYLLNSNRELAAAYTGDTPTETGSGSNLVKRYHKELMAKWVLDKSVAPYPILKEQGTYPSVVNYDPKYTNDETGRKVSRSSVSERNKGKMLGSLTVTITGVGSNAPSGASLLDENGDATTTRTLTLQRTDKDYNNYNYNYNKVQLPYYNDVGTKNYTSNKVVTGWTVSVSNAKSFGTTDYDYPNYNLADRFSTVGRVYSQGAYFDVPDDVSSISIEPYWGNAVYLSDGYHDCYGKNTASPKEEKEYEPVGLEDFGRKYVNNQQYYINPNDNSDANKQVVYTNIATAITNLPDATSVYDNAVVLVGNFHRLGTPSNGLKPFTIMSADLDYDNEPDYSLIVRSGKAAKISPIRFDFINVPGVVMAHKMTSTTQMGILGNMKLLGWFEVTNTCVIRFSQFEYDFKDGNEPKTKALAPLILLGGVVEQFVSTNANDDADGASHTEYIHVGSNVWFKMFSNGCHMDKKKVATPHRPISVTGGEYEKFYLSGYFQPNAPVSSAEDDKNAECYIDGGKFGEVAGAGQEKIDGNVTWEINNADIESFFGGGINDAKPVTGDINVTINNSHVGLYCGGPKFGNMTSTASKKALVETNATNSTFGKFYGAGYGGTAIYRDIYSPGSDKGHNRYTLIDYPWMEWLGDAWGYSRGQFVSGKGIATGFEVEHFEGSNTATVGRLYVYYSTLSVAKTNSVTSTLTGCTIKENFYGGGNLGSVNGDIVSSLTDCTVNGSAYGAGCSSTPPTAKVYDTPTDANFTGSKYNTSTGIFEPTDYPDIIEYTWSNTKGSNSEALVDEDIEGSTEQKHWIHVDYDPATSTGINLNDLGVVTGEVTLTIDGTSTVDGSVYGGGEESAVGANTNVNVDAGTVSGNVYGGGKLGSVGTYTVSGSTYTFTEGTGECSVTIAGGTIGADVFGAGKGIANTFQCEKGMVYKANVIVSGGTVNGTVYGGGEIGRVENDTEVKIGDGVGGSDTPTPNIHGNIFGAGKGLNTHGYSALVRGNSKVTVEGDSRVLGSIYGGGEISSVGRYTLVDASNQSQYPGLEIGMPGSLANSGSGECTVIVQGHAAIGPNGMQMTASGGPDDAGHIFGAGKGATPQVYTYEDKEHMPRRMMSYTASLYPEDKKDVTWEYADDEHNNVWEYFDTEAKYLTFIETMALTTQTEVTVDGNAFVKGSVYGGSENGFVQHDTKVMIKGGQIGAGAGESSPYADDKFVNPATTPVTAANTLKACATWTFVDDGAPYDKFAGATGYDSKGGATVATDGHTFYGNVFGGGSGFYPYAPGKWHRKAGSVGGDTRIEISGGHILTNVYGGNEQTDVGTYTHDDDDTPYIAAGGTCTIVMTNGTIGVPRIASAIEALPTIGHLYGAGKGDKRILFNTWTNVGATSVSVTGGIVYGNVYGGGEDGHVMGNSVTTISETDATNKPTVIGSVGDDGLDGNVFGGGQGSPTALTAGVIGGSVNLGIQGGHILGSVYGGGRIASVGTFFAMATDPRYGMMQDDVDDDEATTDVDESVTHGHLTVNLTGGIIEQNVYGGCMGTNAAAGADDEAIAFAAKLGMSKTVEVNLNKNVADNAKGCVVVKDIFGCNNTNSSPQGSVVVNIYATQNKEKTQIANTAASGDTPAVTDAKRKGVYDVRAVYGGGNLAAYTPLDATSSDADTKAAAHTTVNITGCRTVSIQQVYGGGNAASTPATEVNVEGTFEIYELFGGGNGKDDLPDGSPNPGANVGYYAYPTSYDPPLSSKEERTEKFQYGSGKAAVNILGGTVHRVFGGSNTKGNVRQTAVTMLEEAGGCPFCVDEAYGGGKSAPMDAEAKLLMACIPGLSAAYGGAEAADIQSNVILNITNGTFNRVFGGNNISGTIRGSITVNIEEIGCKPIIIGELYGGGNMAGYSVFGYKQMKDGEGESAPLVWKPRVSLTDNTADGSVDNLTTPYRDPEVNVKSFTSIGTIYGGGYGTTAVMAGSPTVNINVVEGDKKHYTYAEDTSTYLNADNEEVPYFDANGFKELKLTIDGHEVLVPKHDKNKIGAINKVFGGGNAAQVIGSTNVNIGTLEEVYVVKVLSDGADLDNLAGGLVVYTRSGAGTTASPYTYTVATGTADPDETYYEKKTVIGADIRDNVYGGGNNAEVTGATNVTIGREL